MNFLFVTGTPASVAEGSGTWTGITTLATALRRLGHGVTLHALKPGPGRYHARRLAFNGALRKLDLSPFDAVVGFDMDGHTIAGSGPLHVASIKGVIADEARFEKGATRRMMLAQSRLEGEHCRRADLVMTVSRYSVRRLRELYRLPRTPAMVPELLDLGLWKKRLRAAKKSRRPGFTVLCVCRLFPRKRVEVLLGAAARLRGKVRVRIVGDGPEERRLHALHRKLDLDGTVEWLGYIPPERLAAEYRSADVFCLPSEQEGFGIVLLEAMAAGLPVVASRAAAVPEVAAGQVLLPPRDEEALARAIERLRNDPARRRALSAAGKRAVAAWDAPRVARQFLRAIRDTSLQVRTTR